MKRHCDVAPVAALIERNVKLQKKRMKLISGCQGCEEIRMKPVKAWAVVRNQRLQGQATNGMDVLLVMPTKKGALKHKYLAGDRLARVEICEVDE